MTDETVPRRSRGELALRLASAAVLIPFALFVVSTGGWLLAVACALFAGLMGYEWARMTGIGPAALIAVLALLACLALVPFGGGGALAALFGSAVLAALWASLRGGAAGGVSAFLGVVYVGGMPLALLFLREGPWDGQTAALIFMSVVWASDAAAYFAGKGFGGPRLSPRESPNKTWSGAIGGVIATALCGVIAAYLTGGHEIAWLTVGILISVFAQLGDLLESQVKRRFGVKDVSGFIPGHGGVLDRVDGLGAVCVVTVLVFLAVPGMVDTLGLSA